MRVVMVVTEFPKLSESFIVNKFAGLLEQGWDVHVVCKSYHPGLLREFPGLHGGIDVRKRVTRFFPLQPRWMVPLRMFLVFFWLLAVTPLRTMKYLRKVHGAGIRASLQRLYLDARLIRLKPNIIHYEFGTLARQKMYLREALPCRIVVSFRGFDISYAGLEVPGFYEDVWRNADRLHFLGDGLFRLARARGYSGVGNHVLIPPSIDPAFFAMVHPRDDGVLGSPDRPLHILSVGRLSWKKGYEYAVAAMSRLAMKNLCFQYVIIGDGPSYEAVAFAIHQYGVEDKVTLIGAQPHEMVRVKMQEAHVFLHTAVSEGFCNAVLEAQAMCLPVVCSDATGLSENVVNGATGFVTPRRDSEAIANSLERIARDPDLRERMGKAGRERVLAHFQLKDQIGRFSRLYSETLRANNVENPLKG